MDLSFADGDAASPTKVRRPVPTESDQQNGGEERGRTVGTFLDRALERHSCGMLMRPLHVRQRDGEQSDSKGWRGNANPVARELWLMCLLGLPTARVGGHLAAAVMLRRSAARAARGGCWLPPGARNRRRNTDDGNAHRQEGRDSLPHVSIVRVSTFGCQTANPYGNRTRV
jgi:hypothetical protein